MPRPITPTQFTVFTRASALAVKMSPRVISIILPSSSTSSAPPQLQADGALPRSCSQHGERSHRRSHQYVQPTPKETTSQPETLLVSALSRRVSPIRGLDSVPIEDAQLANVTEKRRIPRPRVSIAERPAPSAVVRPFDGSVEISIEVNDRSLSTAIRQFRVISLI